MVPMFIVYRVCPSLNGGLFEITMIVLKVCVHLGIRVAF